MHSSLLSDSSGVGSSRRKHQIRSKIPKMSSWSFGWSSSPRAVAVLGRVFPPQPEAYRGNGVSPTRTLANHQRNSTSIKANELLRSLGCDFSLSPQEVLTGQKFLLETCVRMGLSLALTLAPLHLLRGEGFAPHSTRGGKEEPFILDSSASCCHPAVCSPFDQLDAGGLCPGEPQPWKRDETSLHELAGSK